MKYHHTIRLFNLVNKNLFLVTGTLGYRRTVEAIIALATHIQNEDIEDDFWTIGEHDSASIGDLLEGAYWFFSDWYCGQTSDEYIALCQIGQTYKPSVIGHGVDPNNFGAKETYSMLEELFEGVKFRAA